MTGKCPFSPEGVAPGVSNYLRRIIDEKYSSTPKMRIFHAKLIGVVSGTLTIPNFDKSDRRHQGLFQCGRTYEVRIRFTDGSPTPIPDGHLGAHGMAIKIFTPTELNYFDQGSPVQDIILFNNPIFYPYQPDNILPAMKSLLAKGLTLVKNFIRTAVQDLGAALRFVFKRRRPANLLEETYFSATPYKFGKIEKIKWMAIPTKAVTTSLPPKPRKDQFLQEQLIEDLKPSTSAPSPAASFRLCVQFQEDKDSEPIENCAIEWKTEPFEVGVIDIPAQDVEIVPNTGLDHQLWYSPGNALEDHAPLGFINLVRAQVYRDLAIERLF